jgi:hypothetical protein
MRTCISSWEMPTTSINVLDAYAHQDGGGAGS